MKFTSAYRLFCLTILCCFVGISTLQAFESEVKPDTRCTICGMFVAKYPAWICKITHENEEKKFFDGFKDMLVYYFNPEKYGAAKDNSMSELLVLDYYSLVPLDAKKAFFVVGSDVYGPMGHEFIPFSSVEAAEAFKKDHYGKEIVTLDKITSERVESMRSGSRMK